METQYRSLCAVSPGCLFASAGRDESVHVAMMVIREMNGSVAGTDTQLHRIMAVVYSLRVVVEDKNLPGPIRELSSCDVDVQRLGGFQEAVECGVLPPAE